MKKNVIIAVVVAIAILIVVLGIFVFAKKSAEEGVEMNSNKSEEVNVISAPVDKELELMEVEEYEIGAFAKIDEDLANGEITLDEMYIYKLLAMYGYEKLPEKYTSANVDPLRGDRIIMMIQEDWERLEVETQEILEPFILSFSDKNSFFYHDNYEFREEIISNLSKQ
jgi:hypothetical protein